MIAVLAVILSLATAAYGQRPCATRKDVTFLIELEHKNSYSAQHAATFLANIQQRLTSSHPHCIRIAIIAVTQKQATSVLSLNCVTRNCFNAAKTRISMLRGTVRRESRMTSSRQGLLKGIHILADDTFSGERKNKERIVVAVLMNAPPPKTTTPKDYIVEDAFKDVQDVADRIIVVAIKGASKMNLAAISHTNHIKVFRNSAILKESTTVDAIYDLIFPPIAPAGLQVSAPAELTDFIPLQADLDNTCDKHLVDIGFLVDSSGSLKADYDNEKFFVKRVATRFKISESGSHAGVIIFSESLYIETKIKFDQYYDATSFNQAVQNLPFYGYRTRIDLALKMANDELFTLAASSRPNVKKILFLITDGRQNPDVVDGNRVEPAENALPLHEQGVQIFAVGVGRSINFTELGLITREPGRVYVVQDFLELVTDDFVKKVSQAVCEAAEKAPAGEEIKAIPCNTTEQVRQTSGCKGNCSSCCGTQNIYINVFNGNTPAYVVQGVQIVQSGNVGPGSGVTLPGSQSQATNPFDTQLTNSSGSSSNDIVALLKKILPYQKRLTTTIEDLLSKAAQQPKVQPPDMSINRKRRSSSVAETFLQVASANGARLFAKLISKQRLSRFISKLQRHGEKLIIFAPNDEAMRKELGTTGLHTLQLRSLLKHHVGLLHDESERVMKCADGKHFLKFYSSNLSKHLHPDQVEGVNITRGPLTASNAVVYIIADILRPSQKTLRQMMHNDADLSTFASLMQGTGLWKDMRHPMRVNNLCAGVKACVPSVAFKARYDDVIQRKQFTIFAPTNAAINDYIRSHPNYTKDIVAVREGLASHIIHGTLLPGSVASNVARCDASISGSNVMRCVAAVNGTNLLTNFHTIAPHVTILGSRRAADGVLYKVAAYRPVVVQVDTEESGDEGLRRLDH